jgi:hypothetical protein
MKLINILPVHNEAWVLELCLRSLLRWTDAVVVLLHACTDSSGKIVERIASETGRISILREDNQTWQEMSHRQRMLTEARRMGATHVSLFDCDEILTGNLLPDIRLHIDRLPPCGVLELPGYNLRHGIERYHANGVWGNRWFAAAFADDRRLGWSGDRFHHREPMGPARKVRYIPQGQGGIMHLWGASERRLIAKHRLYKIRERILWPSKSVTEIDAMYSLAIHGQPGTNAMLGQFGTPENWIYAPVPESWWSPYCDVLPSLDLDAAPAADAECDALLKEHGAERFAGMDLFEDCYAGR